jgi:hypothetical protein
MTPQRVIPKVSQNKLFRFQFQNSFATGRAVRVENMNGELCSGWMKPQILSLAPILASDGAANYLPPHALSSNASSK